MTLKSRTADLRAQYGEPIPVNSAWMMWQYDARESDHIQGWVHPCEATAEAWTARMCADNTDTVHLVRQVGDLWLSARSNLLVSTAAGRLYR